MLIVCTTVGTLLVGSITLLLVILAERKVLGFLQGREGPFIVGVLGLAQTPADGLKIFIKSVVFSRVSDKLWFFIFPVFLLCAGFFTWLWIPVSDDGGGIDFRYDILLIYFFIGVGALIFIISAWASAGSRYSLLAALREVGIWLAFELIFGFCFLIISAFSSSLNLRDCVFAQSSVWYVFTITPYAFFFFTCLIAETHRTPFDLAEAESELTAGYQTEYGGLLFSLFYLAEYNALVLYSVLFVWLFLGGWGLPAGLLSHVFITIWKTAIVLSFAIAVRAALPRTRLLVLVRNAWSFWVPGASSILPLYFWLAWAFCGVWCARALNATGLNIIARKLTGGVVLWSTNHSTHDVRWDPARARLINRPEFNYPRVRVRGNEYGDFASQILPTELVYPHDTRGKTLRMAEKGLSDLRRGGFGPLLSLDAVYPNFKFRPYIYARPSVMAYIPKADVYWPDSSGAFTFGRETPVGRAMQGWCSDAGRRFFRSFEEHAPNNTAAQLTPHMLDWWYRPEMGGPALIGLIYAGRLGEHPGTLGMQWENVLKTEQFYSFYSLPWDDREGGSNDPLPWGPSIYDYHPEYLLPHLRPLGALRMWQLRHSPSGWPNMPIPLTTIGNEGWDIYADSLDENGNPKPGALFKSILALPDESDISADIYRYSCTIRETPDFDRAWYWRRHLPKYATQHIKSYSEQLQALNTSEKYADWYASRQAMRPGKVPLIPFEKRAADVGEITSGKRGPVSGYRPYSGERRRAEILQLVN